MIITVKNSAPFQILTSAMVIGPSQTGYQLEVAADGRNFSPLFSVGPNVTRQATNLSSGAYYRLNGNVGDVVVNWRTSCVTEGGAAGNELTPVTEFPLNADPGTVVALASGDTYGIYQYDGTNWNEAGADVDLSAYWTSAETQSAITAVEDHLFDVEQVTASALTELHDGLLEVSARTVDMSDYWTSAQTEEAISAATSGKADAANIAANTARTVFPKWNSQGVITGEVAQAFASSYFYINNTRREPLFSRIADVQGVMRFYIPETSGNPGDILVSTGNGAPVWSAMPAADVTKAYVDSAVTELQDQIDTMDEVASAALVNLNNTKVESQDIRHMVKLSQAAYDQLSVKDPQTFYIIVNSN